MIEKILTPEMVTAIGSGIAAITALVVAIANGCKAAHLSKLLEEAKQRETYIICPHCKKKTPLSEVEFRLPSGELDNNLNGKPDISE